MDENQRRRSQDEEMTIDLLELFQVLWNKAWLILLCVVIGAGAAFIYTKEFVTPQYKSKAMIYVYAETNENQAATLTDLQIGAQLAIDLTEIATTREVVETPIKTLHLNYTYEELLKKISINHPQNSRLLAITVTDPDPKVAAAIANSLANTLRYRIGEIMNADVPALVESAVVADHKSSPSLSKNTAIGGLLAGVLVCAVLIIIYLVDDTIKTEDDVEKYLQKNVLAVFPVDEAFDEDNTVSKGAKWRRKFAQKLSRQKGR